MNDDELIEEVLLLLLIDRRSRITIRMTILLIPFFGPV
jgi:hypothetical protein